jgi:hypothetical protein
LDQGYLREWATNLGIDPLLDAALRGEPPPSRGAAADDAQQQQLFSAARQ